MAKHLFRRAGGLGALAGAILLSAALVSGCGGELGAVNGDDGQPIPGPEQQPFQMRAVLRGEQETPLVATTASGTGIVTISGDRTAITVVAPTEGLTNVISAHIHVAPPQQAGPIILPLYDVNTDGPFTGTLVRTVTAANLQARPAQGINTFADAITAIQEGRTYLNIHTQQNPAGEIRGQIGPVTLRATLTGAEETPPVVTTANGTSTLQFDAMQTAFSITVNTQNIANVISAHIHVAPRGVAGPIIFPLYDAATDGPFPAVLTRALNAGNLQPQPVQGISTFDDAVSAMLAGRTYVNVHTQQNPAGEIRGQLGP